MSESRLEKLQKALNAVKAIPGGSPFLIKSLEKAIKEETENPIN